MKNWRKYRNYRKYENADGSFTHVITVDGEKVEVSEEVYTAYAEGGYKMENIEALKSDRVLKDADGRAVRDEHWNAVMLPEREVSLDKLIDDNWEFTDTMPSPEDIFLSYEESEIAELHRCISLLADDERLLIKALFFEGKTERKYAKELSISKTALHARKEKVLAKIKYLLS